MPGFDGKNHFHWETKKDYEDSVLDGRSVKPYRSRILCAMGVVILPSLSVLTPGTLSCYKVIIDMRFVKKY